MPEQIPPAEQSVNSMVNSMHNLAASHESMESSVGEILSPPPNIKVKWNNIELTKEQIYIAEYLLAGYKRTGKGHIKSGTQEKSGGKEYAEFESHDHEIDNDYTDTIIYTDTLKVGDIVSVVPIKNGQRFLITDKMIDLSKGYKGAEK